MRMNTCLTNFKIQRVYGSDRGNNPEVKRKNPYQPASGSATT